MQNGAKFPGIFLKTYSREFPDGNSRWPCSFMQRMMQYDNIKRAVLGYVYKPALRN